MPLLLLDLDNTLVDRAAAVRAWAADYLAERRDDPSLLEAVVAADGDGLRPKPDVAADLTALLHLSAAESAEIIVTLRAGVIQHLRLVADAEAALALARDHGWTPFIVTNGQERQQERKIASLGLHTQVAGWVISEAVGIAKPDPRIFALAAEATGQSLADAWMVGDSAEADIVGAHAAGLRSAYLLRGRTWPQTLPAPTVLATSLTEAVEAALAWR